MPDPVFVSIAAALAGKAAASVVSSSVPALRSLVDLVKRKFTGRQDAAAALTAAQAEPEPARIETLAAALQQAAQEDPQFAERMLALWNQTKNELHADRGGVVNEVSGTVSGNLVQARDISGGVSFGDAPRRDR